MRREVPALWLVALVLVAGCSTFATSPTATPEPTDATPTGSPLDSTPPTTPTPPATPTPTPDEPPPDPAEDVVGWEQGYWHNESVDVEASDGLNDAEFRRVKARAMARVEVVRGLEFRHDVAFEFQTREEFEFPVREQRWSDVYWEAAFVVGENRRAATAYRRLFDVIVDGAAYGGERVVMIVEDPASPRIDTAVLAHELVHAIEAQNDVYAAPSPPVTADERQARSSVVEGSAMYYEAQYTDRCGEAWSCIDLPEEYTLPPGADRVNMALYVDFALRYTAGRTFVASIEERGELERMREHLPESTEQVVHPERYPDERPVAVPVEDHTSDGWHRLERRGSPSTWDTLGEARLYTMLWYNGVIDGEEVRITKGQQVPLNYSHPATDGWAGDRVVVYTDGSAYGYVFESRWDSERDARQFAGAYRELLRSKGARTVREGVYVVESGPFADAFRVVRRGDTVVVVNAPTVDALDEVHAPA